MRRHGWAISTHMLRPAPCLVLALFAVVQVHLGASQDDLAAYDCSSAQQEWTVAQHLFCCKTQGLGCRHQKFDCLAGWSSWEFGWSDLKKLWCCKHEGRGCQGQAPVPELVPQPEPAPSPRVPHPTAAAEPHFNCQADSVLEQQDWSPARRTWCCRHARVGCAVPQAQQRQWEEPQLQQQPRQPVPPHHPPFHQQQEENAVAQQQQPPAHSPLYSCSLDDLEAWTEEERAWCCRHRSQGCPTSTTTASASPDPFDCRVGGNRAAYWGVKQQAWCCANKQLGCVPTTPTTTTSAPITPYTCSSEDEAVVASWDKNQQVWCCLNENRGCTSELTSGQEFNCRASADNWPPDWTAMQRVWCCRHTRRGCPTLLEIVAAQQAAQEALGCSAPCDYGGHHADCRLRVEYAVAHRFRGHQHACVMAHTQVVQECHVCSHCTLEALGCDMPPTTTTWALGEWPGWDNAAVVPSAPAMWQAPMTDAVLSDLATGTVAPALTGGAWGAAAPAAAQLPGRAPLPPSVTPQTATVDPTWAAEAGVDASAWGQGPQGWPQGSRPSQPPLGAAVAALAAAAADTAKLPAAAAAVPAAQAMQAAQGVGAQLEKPTVPEQGLPEVSPAQAIMDQMAAQQVAAEQVVGPPPAAVPQTDSSVLGLGGESLGSWDTPASASQSPSELGVGVQVASNATQQAASGCQTVCKCGGFPATCRQRVQSAADGRFSRQTDPCVIALVAIIDECPCCASCSLEDALCTAKPRPFDCAAGFENWQESWSDAKKDFCCSQDGRGCPPLPEPLPYDCMAGYANWAEQWTSDKQVWCCEKQGLGCLPTATTPPPTSFDCEANFVSWQQVWSREKKVYCCQYASVGCEETVESGEQLQLGGALNLFGRGGFAQKFALPALEQLPALERRRWPMAAPIFAGGLVASLSLGFALALRRRSRLGGSARARVLEAEDTISAGLE